MLYQMKAYQSQTGRWHCSCVDNLKNGSGVWWHPARILGISPAAFVSLLLNDYQPDDFYYNEDKNYLEFSWNNQIAMKKFMNFINKKAREINYQI